MGTVQKCGPIGSGPGSALRLAGIHAAWAPHITNKLSNSKPVRQLSRNCLEFKRRRAQSQAARSGGAGKK